MGWAGPHARRTSTCQPAVSNRLLVDLIARRSLVRNRCPRAHLHEDMWMGQEFVRTPAGRIWSTFGFRRNGNVLSSTNVMNWKNATFWLVDFVAERRTPAISLGLTRSSTAARISSGLCQLRPDYLRGAHLACLRAIRALRTYHQSGGSAAAERFRAWCSWGRSPPGIRLVHGG